MTRLRRGQAFSRGPLALTKIHLLEEGQDTPICGAKIRHPLRKALSEAYGFCKTCGEASLAYRPEELPDGP